MSELDRTITAVAATLGALIVGFVVFMLVFA